MKIYYDQKEKFFTDCVTKVPLPVIISTLQNTITGNIHLRPEERLIDGLSSEGRYRAVTDAVIFSHEGEVLYRARFFTINLDNVVWIMPVEDTAQKPKFLGGS